MHKKIIGYWLLLGVAMLMIQVLLGGITRLTGSGLSITEWKPIMGFIPPLNEGEWQIAFEKYKQIGQFQYLNQDFDIADFKFIYFWEWFHRNWARFIAVAFLIPFFYFLYKRYLDQQIIRILLSLFLLGIAQGLIGWIMVASGLNNDNLYVSHIKLAIHFVSAMVLIGFTFWFALKLVVPEGDRINQAGLFKLTSFIMIILIIQLTYGAFMAGLKAGSAAATWPSINGDYFPATLFNHSIFSNTINIHFIHRMLAYLLFVLVIVWYFKAIKTQGSLYWKRYRIWPLLLVILQVLLGIFTVVTADKITRNGFGNFEYLAQAHQLIAMFLSMALIWALFMLRKRNSG